MRLLRRYAIWLTLRSAPEDAGGVAVDLGEQVVDGGGRGKPGVGVEALMPVGPIQRPGLVCGVVAQAGDCGAAPVRREVLAPWRASFHDRQVAWSDFALDTQLVASLLGNTCGAP